MSKSNPPEDKIISDLLALTDDTNDKIAAFDADGTLWRTDMGEAFFQYQIDHCNLPLPPDPWGHYNGLKAQNQYEKAYLWLAQINRGIPITQVRHWAEQSVQNQEPLPIFPAMRDLVTRLQQQNFRIYVVTASVQWAVEPAAKRLGIPFENVIGITTKIQAGVVTDIQNGHITWKSGKPTALLEATKQKRPLICAGNTIGDLPLLECSTGLRLAISSQTENSYLEESEQRLQKVAEEKGWLTLKF